MEKEIDWIQIESLASKVGDAALLGDLTLENVHFSELCQHITEKYFRNGICDWRLFETLGDFAPDPSDAVWYLRQSLNAASEAGVDTTTVVVSLAMRYCYDYEDYEQAQLLIQGISPGCLAAEDELILKD